MDCTSVSKSSLVLAISISCGAFLPTGNALAADWPTNISGTWSVVANQTEGKLIISQSGSGTCKRIVGTIFGGPIQGSYCPGAGTLTFHRYRNEAPIAGQFYRANLSAPLAGKPLRMSGSFATRTDVELPGEFSFYGTKP